MCHLVLLLPLFGLPVFWLWPPAVAVPAYLVVAVVSAGVYYLTFVALRLPVTAGPETLVGARGQVVGVESGDLQVRVQSELWRASANESLDPGESVEVQGIDGLTLKVRRPGDGSHQPPRG